jgi:hypothetical protein
MSVQIEDLELLDTARDFALDHPHLAVGRFKPSMRAWGDTWQAVTPAYLAAADYLGATSVSADPRAEALLAVFERHKNRLRWEQSYKKEEGTSSYD